MNGFYDVALVFMDIGYTLDICPSGGMADALDLKSGILLDIRVRLPSRVLFNS